MTDFIIIDDLRQHHLESYEDEYWKRRDVHDREKIGLSTEEGLIVRAGFAAGWFGDGYKVDADERVKNMSPAKVYELAQAMDAKRRVVRAIDPKLLYKLAITYLGKAKHLDLLEELGALNPGEMVAVKAGNNGKLALLKKSTTVSTSLTPATPIKEQAEKQLNGQNETQRSGKLLAKS